MKQLPAGWDKTTVDEVCEKVRGVSYEKNEAFRQQNAGLLPILRANNIVDDRLTFDDLVYVPSLRVAEKQRMVVNDVVVAMSSGSKRVVGKTAQLAKNWNGSFGAFCCVLRPRPEIDGRFLGYFFRTADYRSKISALASGTNINNVKNDHFAQLDIPIPPLNEQRRIVAKVEKLLSRVNAAEQRVANTSRILRRFRQSALSAAFEFHCTGNSKRIDEIFSVQTGGTPDRKNSAFYIGGTIPWVKTGEVQNCEIFESEEFITEAALKNSNAKIFPAGTLLIAMYGEGKTRGQIGRLRLEASTNQACAALVNPDLLPASNQYVFFYLLGQYHKLRAEALGGNQPNLNLSIIKSWEIPFPSEAKQQEIVSYIEALFKIAYQIEIRVLKAKTHVDKLTQSILAKAFRGELVPQDPNDEPASVLLERVRLQRNGTASTKVQSNTKRSRRKSAS